MNTGILKDPSGTYAISYLPDGQMSMNITAYYKLLSDPYAGISATLSTVVGETAILQPPDTSGHLSHYPTADNGIWSGAAAGNCTFSAPSNQYLLCSSATTTMQTSGVYFPDQTWDGSCWNGHSSCVSSFWTGLSAADDSSSELLQNGMDVCYNLSSVCSGGGSHTGTKTMTWYLWWENIHGSNDLHNYTLNVYPTSINGTDEEFVFSFLGTSQSPTFQWIIGSFSYSLSVSLSGGGSSQSDFVQTEGIFEAPGGGTYALTKWSTNSPLLTGWGEDPSGTHDVYIGSSYNVGLVYLYYQDGSTLEAAGSMDGTTNFSDTWQ